MRSTVARSMEECRKRGWSVAKLEHWVSVPGHPAKGFRQDLWNVADLLAVSEEGFFLIQSTAGQGDVAKHLRKVAEVRANWEPPRRFPDDPEPVGHWLRSGGRFLIWSWAKRGPKTQKRWTVKEHEVK